MFNIRVFAAMFFVLATLAVSAQKSQEQMRAEYLLYIVNQVEFPNEKDFKVFTIGVMGNEEGIFNELKKLSVDAKTPNGKSINIVRFDSLKHVDKVQMLYVNKAQGFDIGQIILKLTGTKTLVVSENYEFQKSMLNFVYVGGLLRFEINKARIDNEGLYVKPLFAAKAVRSKADWEKLFLSTDKELEEEKLVVEEQKKMIEKQKKEIAEQEQHIARQKEDIAKQQALIDEQKKELSILVNNIRVQQNILKEKMLQVEQQQSEIVKQQEEIVQRNRKLEKQKAEIGEQESKIAEQKEVLNEQLAKIETQQLIMYMFIFIIVMITGLGYFIYRGYRIKKRANKLLHEKNIMIMERNEEIMQQKEEIQAQRDEIEGQRDALAIKNEEVMQQKEEIEAQRDEIERQKDVAEMQRDEIMEQKREITDSIVYARRIQTAILPPKEYIGKNLRKYFILNKPRDIVSGDYYWITEKDNKIIVAAADCTGHGVPGAFMSMLGVALLNQIVGDEIELKANEILNRLREDVINSLRQTGKEGEAKDGMDIAMFIIDFSNNELQFAGANNPLYMVRPATKEVLEMAAKEELPRYIYCDGKYELLEFKADKMPIGIYTSDAQSFTNNEMILNKRDTIYIFSDGYADQFGGPHGKKFKYKSFKELLLSIQDKKMEEQEHILNDTMEAWKEGYDQIDDILVIGVRL